MEAISCKKILLHIVAAGVGVLGAIYIPFENKDFVGWIIGAFTAFGGILLAVMTLTGHSLNLLHGEDWKALQTFKSTYKAQIFFNALVSFLLIFTVLLFLIQSVCPWPYLKNIAGFLAGICTVYVLTLPFSLSKMYISYYDFVLKKQKKGTNAQG